MAFPVRQGDVVYMFADCQRVFQHALLKEDTLLRWPQDDSQARAPDSDALACASHRPAQLAAPATDPKANKGPDHRRHLSRVGVDGERGGGGGGGRISLVFKASLGAPLNSN